MSGDLICGTHGRSRTLWIICAHTEQIRERRPIVNPLDVAGGIEGEAVCDECRKLLDAGEHDAAPLRMACPSCVADRWPEAGAS